MEQTNCLFIQSLRDGRMGQVVLCMTVFLIVQFMQISVSSYDYDHEFKQLAS